MSYTLKDDEVAILLRPVEFDEYGEWSGELSTALSVGPPKRSNSVPCTSGYSYGNILRDGTNG